MLEQSNLRSSLEQVAQSTHEKILREREDAIKSEAEARHAKGIQAMQQHIESLENQLRISLQRNAHFEEALASKTSSLDQARGNLVRVQAGQESLEEDVNDQLHSTNQQNYALESPSWGLR